VHYLVPPLGSVCVLHPQGSLVCRRENQNWNGKGGERRKGERWLVERGQLLTAVFYFILFYFLIVEIRFNLVQRNPD
jgi:hypothetical protein